MERLSLGGLAMSQIDVQRRMRPDIAQLVRYVFDGYTFNLVLRLPSSTTLYENLQDHDVVKNYPHVQGMGADVYSLSHQHVENVSEHDSVSKYNEYEVCDWIILLRTKSDIILIGVHDQRSSSIFAQVNGPHT